MSAKHEQTITASNHSRLTSRKPRRCRQGCLRSSHALQSWLGSRSTVRPASVTRSCGRIYSEASLINSGINTASGSVGQCLTGNSRFMVFVFKRNGLKIDR